MAVDMSGVESEANPSAPLPVLSQSHSGGSIRAVVFSGADPEGNKQALGVGAVGAGSSLLEKRDAERRGVLAHGCRALDFANESEFAGAAGLSSDELYFANSDDLVRRVRPVTRKAAYSAMTEVDEVVFNHDLEGNDKDGSSMLKDAAFA